MKKVCILVASTIGGALGWTIGANVGTMTAFMVSMVGTGLGIYAGARFADHYTP